MKTKKTAAIAAKAKRAKRTSPTRARETVPRSDGKPGKPHDVSWHDEFLRIYETTPRDCAMAADFFIPIPYQGTKGIRVIFEAL